MKSQHSEVFYYVIAVYALAAVAVFTLPNGSQLQQPLATRATPTPDTVAISLDQSRQRTAASFANTTKIAVRSATSERAMGPALADNPKKF